MEKNNLVSLINFIIAQEKWQHEKNTKNVNYVNKALQVPRLTSFLDIEKTE